MTKVAALAIVSILGGGLGFSVLGMAPDSIAKAAESARACVNIALQNLQSKKCIKAGQSFVDGKGYPEVVLMPDQKIAVGKFEVTLGEFEIFARETKFKTSKDCAKPVGDWNASYQKPEFKQTKHHPVVCVNWSDATSYVNWLTKKTGFKYRLPILLEASKVIGKRTKLSNMDICKFGNIFDKTVRTRLQVEGSSIYNCADGSVYTSTVGDKATKRIWIV